MYTRENTNLNNREGYEDVPKRLEYEAKGDKLNKGVWGMPRLSEAMKDAISCEKLRGSAHTI